MRFHLTTLLAATAVLSAPIEPEAEPVSLIARDVVAPNQSTCIAYRDAFRNINTSAFKVTIGRPYLGGGRCPELKAKVGKHFDVKGLKCRGANGNKNTLIIMTSNMKAGNLANVNNALKAAYPEINFSCPTKSSALTTK
ncbi:uncharacterized protein MYCFIDRAFT_77388 [Pseudocercospora fijiensis CIRAD86]|uniref:Uncharacterized protein n=1 Tax=Pseudocercospora fijiensis (strain CIRAD86) TaxID=383855 RepID=M3BCB2_PSEFD|nr:uncharacterized protein MYCFIDRAFT_77388 [Pseudocercospora fijiensis CIRAD86]EME86793.1 hypothetical protein MYCFIDRAFT_77388 [Pseudocercospora fijiensis CIRAD86]